MDSVDALVLTAPRTLERRRFDRPELKPGEALLRVDACGLCGNDHEQFSGLLPITEPFIQGHEIVGTIDEITDAAAEQRGLAVGDRVAVEVFRSCGHCEQCLSGYYPLCREHGLKDSYGNTPLSNGSGLWGGYATHVMLAPESILIPIPDGMDSVYATLFNPLGAGVRWAATVPDLQPGATVAVLGPGLRGLCAVVAAKSRGASFVMLTGAGAADADRLRIGRDLGADVTADVTTQDAKALFKRHAGGLADVVVDVTAGAPQAFLQALDIVRPGGTVVVAGTRGTRVLEQFNPDRLVFKMIRVIGTRGVDRGAYDEAFRILAQDSRFADLPRRTASLDADDMADLLDAMAHGEDRPLHGVFVP